jgi:Protein of unknown function (DUF1648)
MNDATNTHPASTVRIVAVSLVLPLVIAIAAMAVAFSLASHLPTRIPVHWDLAGHPNGFGSPYEFPIIFVAVCVPLIAIFGGAVVFWSHHSPLTLLAKILAVTSVWVTVLVGTLFIGLLLDVNAGAHPTLVIVLALVFAIVVSVGAWFALPPGARGVAGRAHPAAAPLTLAEGERAVWTRTASASRGIIWMLIGLGLVLSAVTLFLTISTTGRYWGLSFLPLVLILVSLSMFAWTVRVDSRGVQIRAALGIPVFRIPLDQVTSANVLDVQSVAQYGGWGIRIAMNQRIGIILRSGEALEIHRKKGLTLVVTVDDAETAAGLLNGMLARA